MSDYNHDYTLETLLDLDGMIVEVGQGLWVKMNAIKIKTPTHNKPYGIKYSLTLHDPDGQRLLGYDNAHRIPKTNIDVPADHKHKGARIIRYTYQNPEQLLADFWKDVDLILKRRIN